MKSFVKPLPSNIQIAGQGDHVSDHNKLVDAINELRAGVPNQASEVNAAPSTILSSGGKVLDSSLASAFIKTINGNTPDSNGNVVITVSGGYDGADAVKTSGTQTISGAKTFTTAPASAADAVNANDLVRKSQFDLKANATATVNISGDQTVAGVKTFSTPPVSSSAATSSTQLVRKNELDLKADATSLAGKADNSSVVTLTGNQSIAGIKTFSSLPVVPITASSDSQLINFGQVKSLIPGLGTPATLLAAQNWDSIANGVSPGYDENVIPNGNATGASVTVQSGTLKWVSPTAAGNVNRKLWYSDNPAIDADINFTFWWDGTGGNAQAWFVFRSSGNNIDRGTGTMFQADFAGSAYNAGRSVGGTYTPYSALGGSKPFTYGTNVKYKFRALLVGQRVRYKIWQASATEPAAWTVDLSDPTDFAGAPATFGIQFGSSSSGVMYLDDLSWSTPATGTVYAQSVNGVVPDTNGNITLGVGNLLLPKTISATSYSLVTTDAGLILECTASNTSGLVNVSIPVDANLNLPVGTVIYLQQFTGGATVGLTAVSGVTLVGTTATSGFTQMLMLRKRAANSWVSTLLA